MIEFALCLSLVPPGVVGSAWYILRQDVRTGGKMLKQNIKTIRGWMEEAQHRYNARVFTSICCT